jgi:hypothetical protein
MHKPLSARRLISLIFAPRVTFTAQDLAGLQAEAEAMVRAIAKGQYLTPTVPDKRFSVALKHDPS